MKTTNPRYGRVQLYAPPPRTFLPRRRLAISSALVLLLPSAAGSAFTTVRYVDVTSANPTPPYASWATAAKTIQEAVHADGVALAAIQGLNQKPAEQAGEKDARIVAREQRNQSLESRLTALEKAIESLPKNSAPDPP